MSGSVLSGRALTDGGLTWHFIGTIQRPAAACPRCVRGCARAGCAPPRPPSKGRAEKSRGPAPPFAALPLSLYSVCVSRDAKRTMDFRQVCLPRPRLRGVSRPPFSDTCSPSPHGYPAPLIRASGDHSSPVVHRLLTRYLQQEALVLAGGRVWTRDPFLSLPSSWCL